MSTIDLRPAQLALATTRGDTLQFTLAFWSDDANTVPIDLTTAETIRLDFRKDRNGPVKLALAIGDGLSIAGDDDNQLVVSKNHSLLPGTYVGDVELAFAGDIVRTYVEISWTLSNDVTR